GGNCELDPPRQVSPLSTAYVSSQQPVLRWELPAGITDARAQVCRDRMCTTVVSTIDTPGNTGSPDTALMTPGVYFWRVYNRIGTATTGAPSAVWEFTVGARSTTQSHWYGSVSDFNGDGLADLAVGA